MHKKLLENKNVTVENQSLVVEILRVIAEMVVYGDSKSELLFEYGEYVDFDTNLIAPILCFSFFCEANMLSLFLDIMRAPNGCPVQVNNIPLNYELCLLLFC
jgi:hypothetical protein